MNFFEGTVTKTGDDVLFMLDCGTNVAMKYVQADKISIKYMDSIKSCSVFVLMNVRVYSKTNYNKGKS